MSTHYICFCREKIKIPGPSCSKQCLLNELISGQNVNCFSKYFKFTGIFAEKMWVAFANAKATHIFFSAKILAYMPYLMIKVLTIS